MHAPDHPDPWASLAESLGVGPVSEPQQPPPANRPVPPRAADRPKPRSPAPASGDWDDLASELGLASTAGGTSPPSTPRPPRPTEEPRAAEGRGQRDEGGERRRLPETTAVHGERGDRDEARDAEAGERRDQEGGERRGRRRRGRRGGRGRRDREGVEAGRPERLPEDAGPARHRRDGSDEVEDRPWGADERPSDDASGEMPRGDAGTPQPRGADDEERPRRRRRGRRGGRGRSRSDREPTDASRTGRGRGEAPRAAGRSEDLDDEPLPASYGAPASARPPQAREPAGERRVDRAGESDESGTGSGRRRRRRGRGGEGRSASSRSGGDSARGRRSRRGGEESSRPARTSRVRRADFAPVSGAYDEDDEGLEFLGVEEAGREPGRRESRPGDDDVLAESGLDGVRDVPSWVEAIGIVIAGNLDARSRGRGEGGRRDR